MIADPHDCSLTPMTVQTQRHAVVNARVCRKAANALAISAMLV